VVVKLSAACNRVLLFRSPRSLAARARVVGLQPLLVGLGWDDDVVGAPPAGHSSVPLALRPAPVIAVLFARTARRLCYRQDPPHDPACKLRPSRDRAVTAVTGVIALRAVIAGIVLPGPIRAARTVAKGQCLP
jgi:hypothetical protein